MKKISFFSFLMLYLIFNACSPKVNQIKTMNNKDVIELNELTQKNYVCKVGQKFSYNAPVHASVGIDSEVAIEDATIVKIADAKFEYQNKNQEKEPLAGGDAATKTYTFEALKVGKTTIEFKKNFRGKIEDTVKFKIEVE